MLQLTNMNFGGLPYRCDSQPVELTFRGELTSDEMQLISQQGSTGNYYNLVLPKVKPAPVAGELKLTKNTKEPTFGGAWYVKGKLVYINRVIYSGPATIVFWSDGTKTISKCAEGDAYSAELGLSMAVLKKILGDETVRKTLTDWLPNTESSKTTGSVELTLKDLRAKRYAEAKAAKKSAKAKDSE